jgi:bifunctional non-homologous end joining protein LigD
MPSTAKISRKSLWAAQTTALRDAPRAPTPTNVRPMPAALVDRPFDRAGWIFEIKWDGFRILAEVDQGQVRLYSRDRLSFTERYRPVTAALATIPHQVIHGGRENVPLPPPVKEFLVAFNKGNYSKPDSASRCLMMQNPIL